MRGEVSSEYYESVGAENQELLPGSLDQLKLPPRRRMMSSGTVNGIDSPSEEHKADESE